MKPRGTEFQGGGAATTDPRKPDYANPLPDVRREVGRSRALPTWLRARGRNPVEVMLDLMAENEDLMFVQPLVNEKPLEVREMLKKPRARSRPSPNSGAHVCQEMGSSLQTHLLSYWVRDKQAFTLEEAVRMLTFENAAAWDMHDRGLLRAGHAADIVVFDEEGIEPRLPTVETDLPGGARRLVQKARRHRGHGGERQGHAAGRRAHGRALGHAAARGRRSRLTADGGPEPARAVAAPGRGRGRRALWIFFVPRGCNSGKISPNCLPGQG